MPKVFNAVKSGSYWLLMSCAVIVTALVVRRELMPRPIATAASPELGTVAEWRSYAATGHRIGPVDAAVTATVFSDYQCPYCKRLDADLRALRQEHEADLAIVVRHYPLINIHGSAREAALAAEPVNEFETPGGRSLLTRVL